MGIITQYFRQKSRSFKDLAVIAILLLIVFSFSAAFDVFNTVIGFVYRHDNWQLDELFMVAIYLVFAIAIYSWRRHKELVIQTRMREKAEAEKARLVPQLENALAEVSSLMRLLPICSSCKKIRSKRGDWYEVEVFIQNQFHTRFDAGTCPSCARKLAAGKRMVKKTG